MQYFYGKTDVDKQETDITNCSIFTVTVVNKEKYKKLSQFEVDPIMQLCTCTLMCILKI